MHACSGAPAQIRFRVIHCSLIVIVPTCYVCRDENDLDTRTRAEQAAHIIKGRFTIPRGNGVQEYMFKPRRGADFNDCFPFDERSMTEVQNR